ncbi:MAG: pilin [Wenzhouxiangella sp.]
MLSKPQSSYARKSPHSGFTLIELMIVTAILATLAAIGLSAYQNYNIRAQTAAGLADIAAGVSTFESLVVARNLTTFNVADLGLRAQTPRCQPLEMEPGAEGFIRCHLAGHPVIAGQTITLQRSNDNFWTCQAPSIDGRFRPDGCVD